MQWQPAPDIQTRINHLISHLDLEYIRPDQITCMRGFGSVGHARARIWGLPKIWQLALNRPPHYLIEVVSEKFDNQTLDQQERILIHELLHIPKNFSGHLSPHRTSSRRTFRHYHTAVETLFNRLKVKSYEL